MIRDANSITESIRLGAAVCVVGAGPVGIALALSLAATGRPVLLVEAGGVDRDEAVQDFYRGQVADPALHSDPVDYRERRLGGTSTIWGGRCMPFDPIDFEPRDWIAASGWPIAPDALDAYYPAASKLCEVGDAAFTAAEALPPAARPMIRGFSGAAFHAESIERLSCPTDFGRRYRDRLERAPGLTVLLNAAVTAVELDPNGRRVATLAARNGRGVALTIAADEVVLAAGGLETTRLMLASRSVHPAGIGNHHDVLGRYYMCHLAGTIGRFHAAGGSDAVWHGYDIADDGTYCRRRLALTPEAQRTHRLGNFVARLHHPTIGDPAHDTAILSALYLGRGLVPRLFRPRLAGPDHAGLGTMIHHLANVARDPLRVAGFAGRMLVGRKLAGRKYPSVVVVPRHGDYMLDFHAEQEPNRDSQVRLAATRDAWGMARLEIDWRYTRRDVATVQGALALLKQDLALSGAGSLDYDPAMVEREMTRYGAYPGHHIGTARMGDDPRTSMVDADCRVHGIANLHLAGSAVFPTSSQANPTLTAVALALRLADRLKRPAHAAQAA